MQKCLSLSGDPGNAPNGHLQSRLYPYGVGCEGATKPTHGQVPTWAGKMFPDAQAPTLKPFTLRNPYSFGWVLVRVLVVLLNKKNFCSFK